MYLEEAFEEGVVVSKLSSVGVELEGGAVQDCGIGRWKKRENTERRMGAE
jgi:hypothetical protein